MGFKATAGSMVRTKALMDQLYEDSMDPDNDKRTTAAKLYFDIAKAISPPEPDVQVSRRAQELSDAELRLMLSDLALAELLSRSGLTDTHRGVAAVTGPHRGAAEAVGADTPPVGAAA